MFPQYRSLGIVLNRRERPPRRRLKQTVVRLFLEPGKMLAGPGGGGLLTPDPLVKGTSVLPDSIVMLIMGTARC